MGTTGACDIHPPDAGPAMPLPERVQLRVIAEKGPHALDLRLPDAAQPVSPGAKVVDRNRGVLPGGQGRAHGHEELGSIRRPDLVLRQAEGLHEQPAGLRQEMERAAKECNRAPDGLAAGQAGDGLVHHRLQDACRDVLPACPLVDQGLYVGFREHSAARGNGVHGGRSPGQLVQARGVGLEKSRHLVDERAGAAGARAVHALLEPAGEVGDLGVLAAQLDGHVGPREEPGDRARSRDHLLHEGELKEA